MPAQVGTRSTRVPHLDPLRVWRRRRERGEPLVPESSPRSPSFVHTRSGVEIQPDDRSRSVRLRDRQFGPFNPCQKY